MRGRGLAQAKRLGAFIGEAPGADLESVRSILRIYPGPERWLDDVQRWAQQGRHDRQAAATSAASADDKMESPPVHAGGPLICFAVVAADVCAGAGKSSPAKRLTVMAVTADQTLPASSRAQGTTSGQISLIPYG